jgi:hypothetical protein
VAKGFRHVILGSHRCKKIDSSTRFDVIERVREAITSPTPLTQLLQDPEVIQTLAGSKHKKNRGGHSGSPHREHRSSPSIMSLVLVEEERQACHLKDVLRSTGDRLEYEIRRADDAVGRAEYAEMRAKDVFTRVAAMEAALHNAEVQSVRSGEELRKYQMQSQVMERELRRVQADVVRLEKQKAEAEKSAGKARDATRQYQMILREYQAREEGQHMGVQKWFDQGRDQGWEEGHPEGFEEGKISGFEEGIRVGRKEGLRAGKERGRYEERRNALDAFDRYLDEEIGADEEVSSSLFALSSY